ncbi:glycosyltransferase family 2 protein [Bradyrhizobium sp. STM 3809]|uniref:glycosyltransferase family 2 protein n=1 Tax=Bradyrhizobium sp. STM 3809 TaxID=551936 RepID=UPI001478241E|nr:glycosyltransferase family 2 protein [Bradyrhizobium sp. STM 3809]
MLNMVSLHDGPPDLGCRQLGMERRRRSAQTASAIPGNQQRVAAMTASATVDVIIAVRNNAGTIERAVRSALAEPEVGRVIVIDDQSIDDTALVVQGLSSGQFAERIVLEQMPRNVGPAAARNRGVQLSDAAFVAILDGDDYFKPGRIRALLDRSDGADFVADDHLQVREGEPEDASSTTLLLGLEREIDLTFDTFVAGNISQSRQLRKEYGFLKPIIRRAFLDRYQLRYDEKLRLGEDFALYAKALAQGAIFRVIPSKTYIAIVRSGSISSNHTKLDLERLRDSDRELGQFASLTEKQRKLIRQHYESIDARVQWLNVIDAVKARDLKTFVSAFFIRRSTSSYLIGKLLEQLFVRFGRLLLVGGQTAKRR